MIQKKQIWSLTVVLAFGLMFTNSSCTHSAKTEPSNKSNSNINSEAKTGEDLIATLNEIVLKDIDSIDKAITQIEKEYWEPTYDLREINHPTRPRFGDSEFKNDDVSDWPGYDGVLRIIYWSRRDKKDTLEVIGLLFRESKVEVFQARFLAPN